MLRIYGVSADQLDVIRSLVSVADEYESGLYVVQLYDNVHGHYSFGDLEISDGQTTATLEMVDFEIVVIS